MTIMKDDNDYAEFKVRMTCGKSFSTASQISVPGGVCLNTSAIIWFVLVLL